MMEDGKRGDVYLVGCPATAHPATPCPPTGVCSLSAAEAATTENITDEVEDRYDDLEKKLA